MSENNHHSDNSFGTVTSSVRELINQVRARASLLVRVGAPVVAVLLAAVGRVAAQEEKKVDCPKLPPQLRAINDLLNQIQSYGFALALGLAAVMITYAGLLYMSGDPANQEKARRIIVNTVIGLLIVGLAGALVEIVKMQICPGGG